ncbi:MAG: cupin domain-containing protein [Rhizobiales bacterium]|nr:cupin domain-containing protein [Hyphomicrobiales bacterium]
MKRLRRKSMQQRSTVPGRVTIDIAADCSDVSRSPFGEQCHLRVSGAGGGYAIIDYRAPAGFGPARHVHHREDEVIHLLEGEIAVWTPERSFTMAAGDVTLLPKDVAHTWRAFGNGGVHFTVTVVPGGFERFFSMAEERGLAATDHGGLTAVAQELGLDVIGPPLTDEDVARIVAEDGRRQ